MSDTTEEIGTVAGQVANAITSSATPITAVANAVADVANDIQPLINPSLLQRAHQLTQGAQTDATNFKNLLLVPDWDGVELMLNGLPNGIGIDISESEHSSLVATERNATAWDILGWYCASRYAKLLADIDQLKTLTK